MSRPFLVLLTTVLLVAGLLGADAQAAVRGEDPEQRETEKRAREEDLSAVASYKSALVKLGTMARQKAGTQDEPALLMRMIETYSRMAAIQFRLMHSSKVGGENSPERRSYQETLRSANQWVSYYIKKHPRGEEVPRALYLRAKARQDMKDAAGAIADYRQLLDNFMECPDKVSAYMSLYDLLVAQKEYKLAIDYMRKLSAGPGDAHYTVTLDHLAFSYFYLNDIPEALKYLEKELHELPMKKDATRYEQAEREVVLNNLVLFYFTGMNSKLPQYSTAGAIPYFKKLNPGPSFSKMVVFFGNLVRSKGKSEDLEVYLKTALEEKLPPQETTDILFVVFESQINQKRYPQLKDTANQLDSWIVRYIEWFEKEKVRLREREKDQENFDEAAADRRDQDRVPEKSLKKLSNAVNQLQEAFQRAKDSPDAKLLREILISVYSATLKTASTMSAQAQIRFNMAELQFSMKNHEAAVEHYRWIVEKASSDPKVTRDMVAKAKFKSIVARYETLVKQNLFPKEMAAKPIDSKEEEKKLAPDAEEWLGWVDKYDPGKDRAAFEVYVFEGNRLLYSQGHVRDALKRMYSWLRTNAKSQYYIPVASLILDSYLKAEKWKETHQLAGDFLKHLDPSKASFKAKLQEVLADTYFKISEGLYRNQSYKEVLLRSDQFLKSYPDSKLRGDILAMAANAALALQDKKLALQYFDPLMQSGAKPELVGTTILTRASVLEAEYNFAGAASEYRRYLALPAQQRPMEGDDLKNLREKLLLLAWMSGNAGLLQGALAQPGVCQKDNLENCERLAALQVLTSRKGGYPATVVKTALEKMRSATPATRAIWAAIALDQPKIYPWQQRLPLVEAAVAEWGKTDPMTAIVLIPYFNASIPMAFRLTATEIRSQSRLNPKTLATDIPKRKQLIEKAEPVFQRVSESRWAAIRAGTLNAWANLWSDFARDVEKLPPPPELKGEVELLKAYQAQIAEVTDPLSKRSQEIRKKASEIANETGVEPGIAVPILVAIEAEAPKDQAPVRAHPKLIFRSVIDPALIAKIKAQPAWSEQALRAAKSGNVPLLAHLVQEAKDQKFIEEETDLTFLRSMTLSMAGAQAEAVVEMGSSWKKYDDEVKAAALGFLTLAHFGAGNQAKTGEYLKSFLGDTSEKERKAGVPRNVYPYFTAAAEWIAFEDLQAVRSEFGPAPASAVFQEAEKGKMK